MNIHEVGGAYLIHSHTSPKISQFQMASLIKQHVVWFDIPGGRGRGREEGEGGGGGGRV